MELHSDLERSGGLPGLPAGPSTDRARGGGRPPDVPECATRSIAEDVINRLVMKADLRQARDEGLSDAELDSLCDALVSPEPDDAADLLRAAHEAGASPDRIYLSYIAGAARRLGERWEDDRVSFVDVTLGLSRLHQIIRDLGPAFFATQTDADTRLTALFAAVPGESHVLGVVLAADFFRRQGWQVDIDTCATTEGLLTAASARRYSAIGLSAGTRRARRTLTELVPQLRFAAETAFIMIGGHLTEMEPDIARITGADAIVRDPLSEAHRLKRLVAGSA